MFAKQSMINWLSNPINRNRSAAKISKVMSSTKHTQKWRIHQTLKRGGYNNNLGRRSPWWRGRQEGEMLRLYNNMHPVGGALIFSSNRSWPRRSLNWLSKAGLGDHIGGRSVRVKLQGKKRKSSIVFLLCDFTILVQCLIRCRATWKYSQTWNKNSNSDKCSLWTAVETKTKSINLICFLSSRISTFQVVLQFNRGTSDPDGDGNFDCIPAVDNFQVSLKKAKKTRMKITFYIAL